MNDLKNTTSLVLDLLEQNEQCRNSDSYLYLKVLSVVAKKKGINLYELTVPVFLLTMGNNGFPGFETVRRTRQKIQQHRPDLAACDAVEGFRAENDTAFRAYAVGDV